MIRVVYRRKKNSLRIEGHAFSGDAGQDLVCAGVSALAYTLAANVEQMRLKGQAQEIGVKMDKGNARIWCQAVTGCEDMVRRVFEAVCVGFEIMAENFSKNIAYEVS